MVRKGVINGGMASNDPNFKIPPMINVLYETLDNGRKNQVARGMLSVPLDLATKENIYAITYGKMKELLPEMKGAKDDI